MKHLPKRKKSEPVRRMRARTDDQQLSNSYSYHARRSDQEVATGRMLNREVVTTGLKAHLNGFWAHRFGAIVLIIALVVSAVNVLTVSNGVTIVPLTKDSPFLHSQQDYEKASTKVLSESLLNRNKLTLDTGRLSRELTRQFPELTSATVTIPLLGHKPVVYVQTAQPALILAASNGSYVVSTAGKALIPSSQLPVDNTLELPTLGDQSGIAVTLNQQALTSDSIRFIQVVQAQITAKNQKIGSMTLPATASELDVAIAGQPYFVKFNLQSNTAREQVGTYLATMAQLQKQNITPTKYVDVRVDGRAYYQ